MTNRNMMVQEMNDIELGQVTGGGFFSDLWSDIKKGVPAVAKSVKDLGETVWDVTKTIVTVTMR